MTKKCFKKANNDKKNILTKMTKMKHDQQNEK